MKTLISIILLVTLTACATAPQPIQITVNCNGNAEDLRANIQDALEEVRRPWHEKAMDFINRYVILAVPLLFL